MLEFSKLKMFFVCSVLTVAIVFALPNFVTHKFLPSTKMNLGLDLQGGSHLLLKVEADDYFKTQYENMLDDVRKMLREKNLGYKNLSSNATSVSFEARESADLKNIFALFKEKLPDVLVTSQTNNVSLSFAPTYVIAAKARLIDQSIEILRKRIDESGTKEPIIIAQGQDRIILQVAGVENPEEVKSKINKTAKLTFHAVSGTVPVDRSKIPAEGHIILPDNEGKFWEIEKRATLGGENLIDASQGYDQFGRVAVHFRFDNRGGKIFGDFTRDNVGNLFASVLDGKVISAPRIQEPILGGQGQITGNYTAQEAAELSSLLRAGALPATLKILEERSVGASLGSDSIKAGSMASIVGTGLVAVFMIGIYGFFGIIAVIAVLFNVIIVFAALSVMGATLTLPGIAGIALTVGMAVDANVLIFERMREEVSAKQKIHKVIELGYERAWGTIIDSHLTTISAALLMFTMGSGPVKGFAVTLLIGLISSMFTAVMVTRMIVVIWLRKTKPKQIRI